MIILRLLKWFESQLEACTKFSGVPHFAGLGFPDVIYPPDPFQFDWFLKAAGRKTENSHQQESISLGNDKF